MAPGASAIDLRGIQVDYHYLIAAIAVQNKLKIGYRC
jgi:hypothetical protein